MALYYNNIVNSGGGMNSLLDLRMDGSEKVRYDYDDFMSYIRHSHLSVWPNFSADSHWHDDLEFISVLSGYLDYNVNGEITRINKGQGIIVNSRQLHYGFSKEKKDCEYICVLLHPMLLCTSPLIEREFVAPILKDDSIPYVFLDADIAWQRAILDDIFQICEARKKTTAPLLIQEIFNHIWLLITDNAITIKHSTIKNSNLTILKNMLFFIQKNYAEKVSLADIAKAGNVSKSTCLSIFKRYLQDTPMNFLVSYRLQKSIQLLKDTTLSMTEIALSVGLGGSSYFAETFKKKYGVSPREYKKQFSVQRTD